MCENMLATLSDAMLYRVIQKNHFLEKPFWHYFSKQKPFWHYFQNINYYEPFLNQSQINFHRFLNQFSTILKLFWTIFGKPFSKYKPYWTIFEPYPKHFWSIFWLINFYFWLISDLFFEPFSTILIHFRATFQPLMLSCWLTL